MNNLLTTRSQFPLYKAKQVIAGYRFLHGIIGRQALQECRRKNAMILPFPRSLKIAAGSNQAGILFMAQDGLSRLE